MESVREGRKGRTEGRKGKEERRGAKAKIPRCSAVLCFSFCCFVALFDMPHVSRPTIKEKGCCEERVEARLCYGPSKGQGDAGVDVFNWLPFGVGVYDGCV